MHRLSNTNANNNANNDSNNTRRTRCPGGTSPALSARAPRVGAGEAGSRTNLKYTCMGIVCIYIYICIERERDI